MNLEEQLKRVDANLAATTTTTSTTARAFGELDKAAQKAAKAYAKIVLSAQQFIAAQELERQAIGLTEREANRLRYTQDLMNQAHRAGIKLSADQTAELERLGKQMADTEAQTSALQKALDFGKDLVKGFVSDLRSGLEQGKGFWRSFGDAAMNVLDKIVDKLLNNVIDALFQVNSAAGGMGGGGFLGGLFGGIGKLFGFASGGYTGPGAASQPAGIVHAGEYVFSKSAVDRIGLGYLDSLHNAAKGYQMGGYVRSHMPANINMRGYQSGGYVHPTSQQPQAIVVTGEIGVTVDDDGKVQAYVKRMGAQAVSVSTAQSVDTVKRNLSGWQHQIARDGAVA